MINISFLAEKDEEFQMLIQVAEEYIRQHGKKTAEKRSGDATEIVIRSHFLKHGLNMSEPKAGIEGSDIEIDLLLLKPNVNPNREVPYQPEEVKAAVEVKNNAVGGKWIDGKQEDPNDKIRDDFNELESVGVNLFAVAVLSETLPSDPEKKPYKWRIQENKIGKRNCRVFTLVAREKWRRLYEVDVVREMLKDREMRRTGEWEELLAYLRAL